MKWRCPTCGETCKGHTGIKDHTHYPAFVTCQNCGERKARESFCPCYFRKYTEIKKKINQRRRAKAKKYPKVVSRRSLSTKSYAKHNQEAKLSF